MKEIKQKKCYLYILFFNGLLGTVIHTNIPLACVLSSALADKIITDRDASTTVKAGVGSTWVDTHIAVSSHKQRTTLAVVT